MPGLELFRRFPWQFRAPTDEQVIPVDVQQDFVELQADFAVLAEELLPYFQRFDSEALRRQYQFRRDQVLLIFGGGLAAVLGAIQAATPGAGWPGVAETVVAGGLAAVAFRQRALKARETYSANRLRAESLRSEYFLFLGRIGPYADEDGRVAHLIHRVVDIRTNQSPAQTHPPRQSKT